MKTLLSKIAAVALFAGASLAGSAAHAQNAVRTAVQQGNGGAFVSKTDKVYCIYNDGLGIPGLAPTDCIPLTQTKLLITPSGRSESVLKGTLPANVARPTERIVFNSTYTETTPGPTLGRTYQTVAVIETDGSVTYSGTLENTKGQGNDKGNGKSGQGKSKNKN